MSYKRAALVALSAARAYAQQNESSTPDNGTLIEDEITIHTVTVGLLEHQFYPSEVTVGAHFSESGEIR